VPLSLAGLDRLPPLPLGLEPVSLGENQLGRSDSQGWGGIWLVMRDTAISAATPSTIPCGNTFD
jgi:hypothetical protein